MEVATFGQRLKQLRKDIKQEELAHLLGKRGKSTVSAWETDVNFPSKEDLLALASLFNCSIDYLIGNTNIKNGHIVPEDLLKKHLADFMKDHRLEVLVEGNYTEQELITKVIAHLESIGYKVMPQNGS